MAHLGKLGLSMAIFKYVEKDSGKEMKKVKAIPVTKVIGFTLAIPLIIFELAAITSDIEISGKLAWTGGFVLVWLIVVVMALIIEADEKGYW